MSIVSSRSLGSNLILLYSYTASVFLCLWWPPACTLISSDSPFQMLKGQQIWALQPKEAK